MLETHSFHAAASIPKLAESFKKKEAQFRE